MPAQAILFFLVVWHYGAKKLFYKQAIKIKEAQAKDLSFNNDGL